VWVDVDVIISTMPLEYESTSTIYTLDEVDANSLNENSFQIKNKTCKICIISHMWRYNLEKG
jgi:hypothetical protein